MTTLELHGVDGSVWHLIDRESPVALLDGMGGLHLPPTQSQWATTARGSGRRWKGSTKDYREFAMNVRVGDPAPPFRVGDDWRALDGSFWAALAHDRTAKLVYNGQRTLNFRLGDDNDHEFPKDPALFGKAVYSIACVADQPEWLGAPVTAAFYFAPAPDTNYYGGANQGPPFIISAPTIDRTATIDNHGDLPTYPVWRIIGPATAIVIGVDGHLIPIPFSLQSGEQIIIDTQAQTIVDGLGASLWPRMGSAPVDFAPVPPGGAIPIAIGLEDGGLTSRIEISLTPRYRRAW